MAKISDDDAYLLNVKGSELEKDGKTEEAIALYEFAVAGEARGTHPYHRLLALYFKAKRFDDERRICELAASRWPIARNGYGHESPTTFTKRLQNMNRRKK